MRLLMDRKLATVAMAFCRPSAALQLGTAVVVAVRHKISLNFRAQVAWVAAVTAVLIHLVRLLVRQTQAVVVAALARLVALGSLSFAISCRYL
jgi:hypothetical protein